MWLLLFQWDSMAPLPTTNHLMSKVSGGKLVSFDDDIGNHISDEKVRDLLLKMSNIVNDANLVKKKG